MSAPIACPRCATYDRHRGDRIRAEIGKTHVGPEAEERWRRFLAGVHERHDVRLTVGRVAALMGVLRELEEETR